MFELFANNKKLNLPEDISVNMTWENPFLLQDRIPAPYSLSFTLPYTTPNLVAFGNPQRLNSASVNRSVSCRGLFNSVGFIKGKLVLQEVEKKLKVNFQGDELPGSVRDNLDVIEMENFNFGEGSRFFPDFNSGWAKLYKDTIFNNSTIGEKFACCPVRIENENWPYDDPGAFGNYAATKMYLNFFNVVNGNYLMSSGVGDVHTAIFPQPYIHYLLSSVFGGKLGENPFYTDAELRDLVMITSFHKLYSDNLMSFYHGILLDNSYLETPNQFKMNSFLNSFAFNEFLKGLLKVFCFSLIPTIDGTWDIVHNKSILESSIVENWNGKLTGTPIISYREAQTYAYGYSNESGSNEEEGNTLEVDNINALLAANAGIYRVKSTGEVYDKKLKDKEFETDPDVFEYELKKSGLAGSTDGDNSYSVVSDVGPLPMCVDEYWTENSYNGGIPKFPWYVPNFDGDRTKKSFSPSIGFFRGWINASTGVLQNDGVYTNRYPLISPYDKDLSGFPNSNYSLAWDGNNGLLNKFHKEFKAYIEKDKVVLTGYFRLSELDLKNLNWKRKIFLRGKHFFLNKVEVTIKKRSISLSKCELIEA